MNRRMAITLSLSFVVVPPAFPQSPCSDCFKAAEDEMKACLDSAISVEDKTACEDTRDDRLRACNDRECRLEREKPEPKTDLPPQTP
jgi:hypothetical protein